MDAFYFSMASLIITGVLFLWYYRAVVVPVRKEQEHEIEQARKDKEARDEIFQSVDPFDLTEFGHQ